MLFQTKVQLYIDKREMAMQLRTWSLEHYNFFYLLHDRVRVKVATTK